MTEEPKLYDHYFYAVYVHGTFVSGLKQVEPETSVWLVSDMILNDVEANHPSGTPVITAFNFIKTGP